MDKENWDDLRFVLAVVEAGTVSGAARLIGVNHATVLRRIGQFEARHGAEVFERKSHGYVVRPEMAATIEAAREAQQALKAVSQTMRGGDMALTGALRICSTDSICQLILPDFFDYLQGKGLDGQLDILCSNAHLDLARLEADIAVRPAAKLPEELVGEAAGWLGFAVYAAKGRDDGLPWLGLGGPLMRSRPGRWMQENVPQSEVSARADSFVVLRDVAERGRGRTILPCFVGDPAPGLERVEAGFPAMSVPLWVVTHGDLRDTPRLGKMRKTLASFLLARSDLIAGVRQSRESARSQ